MFHSAVAMLATPFLAVILLGALLKFAPRNPSTTQSILYGLAFMLLPGLISGFSVVRCMKSGFLAIVSWMDSRPALWVWIVGLAWIAVGIAECLQSYRPRTQSYGSCSAADNIINAFLLMDSSRCRGASETFDGILYTFPALSAVAYSVGARIALLRRQRPASMSIG
jgi:hypothetical protein